LNIISNSAGKVNTISEKSRNEFLTHKKNRIADNIFGGKAMKNKRIVHGNLTIPTGADVLSLNVTNAVTESEFPLSVSKIPLSSPECVLEARLFSEENEK
jgi:hypothetical protein